MTDILNVKVNGEWVGIPAIKGENGQNGQDGQDGQDGEGVPTGGTTGQVLTKKTNTDFDTEWKTLTASDVGALPDNTIIPTVNNATLTITQGGTSKGTFTANASSDATIAIDNPSWGTITGTLSDQTDLGNELSGKLDTSLTNINNTGKIAIAHNAMPSDTYINLTVGATGTTYTAPEDGYFAAVSNVGTGESWFVLYNNVTGLGSYCQCPAGWDLQKVFIPASKGDVITFDYGGVTVKFLHFIYANGSESEAQ